MTMACPAEPPASPLPLYQRIVVEPPPNIEAVRVVFGEKAETAIFSWGDTIYNPSGVPINRPLAAHEAIHGRRQLEAGVDVWWQQYLEDEAFRAAEEVLAHVAEYRCALSIARDRGERRWYRREIARRLSGPLYGRMMTFDAAIRELKAA